MSEITPNVVISVTAHLPRQRVKFTADAMLEGPEIGRLAGNSHSGVADLVEALLEEAAGAALASLQERPRDDLAGIVDPFDGEDG